MYLSDINALRAITTLPTPLEEFIVGGYYEPGDGGGGTFSWVQDNTPPPDDHGIIIRGSGGITNSGYFMRIYSGPINVRWFGAIIGKTDPNPPIDPFTGLPLAQPIADVTVYVHRARDSKEFADNGTLYFPRGIYPGAFEFTCQWSTPTYIRNEINIVGDGQGTVLTSNGATGYTIPNDPDPYNYPVMRLGYRHPHLRWAKVANLKIDGSFDGAAKFAWGVTFDSQGTVHGAESAGRWIFEQVFFVACDRAVYKFAGNIGNHFIDCTWEYNSFGVYAQGFPNKQHDGCDRYSGGHFVGHTEAALRYYDDQAGGGQIIIDGTIIEQNPGWGVRIGFAAQGRMTWNAVCLRNVWLEANDAGDLLFEGVRSVRIDDSKFGKIHVFDSSINLYNCRHDGGRSEEGFDSNFIVDNSSSLVAYEHRYAQYPNSNIYVNSISYDGTRDINGMDWEPTSVWGPLRVVTCTKEEIAVSEHFSSGGEQWDTYMTNTFELYSYFSHSKVLSYGSNRMTLGSNKHVWSHNVIGNLNLPGYYVWSIHTYLENDSILEEGALFGEIVSDDGNHRLGLVYFKKGQWVCSYGMKLIETPGLQMRLAFKTLNVTVANFCFTDYQIIRFNDLPSANSFVNSRAFAIREEPGSE